VSITNPDDFPPQEFGSLQYARPLDPGDVGAWEMARDAATRAMLAEVIENAVTELAIDLWNADHGYLQGYDRVLWERAGLTREQMRYVKLARLAIKGGAVTSTDGRIVNKRKPLIAFES
jgi:hypothetical protein